MGSYNYGRVRNDKFDELATRSSTEPDPKKREDLIRAALREYTSQVHLLPLHRQVIPWAARANVDVEASVAVLAPLPYGSSVVLLLVASAVGLTVMDVVLGAVAMVVLPMLVFMNIMRCINSTRNSMYINFAHNYLLTLSVQLF